MDCTSITIVLELDGTGDRPFAIARPADGTSRTFHGWLGLVEAIDALAIPTAPNDIATPVAVSWGNSASDQQIGRSQPGYGTCDAASAPNSGAK